MTDNTYNGWTNYETWAVGMFLDGNYTGEGTYREVLELVGDVVAARDTAGTRGEQPFYASYVGDALQEWFEEQLPDLGASIASDLLGAAKSEVNWHELAESKLTEITENFEATS